LLERMQRQPHILAASPALYEQVLVSRGARARGLLLKGIVPQYESRVSELLNAVRVGSADPLQASAGFLNGTSQSSHPSCSAQIWLMNWVRRWDRWC
jgi:lipoprotein-releasing system permease protein